MHAAESDNRTHTQNRYAAQVEGSVVCRPTQSEVLVGGVQVDRVLRYIRKGLRVAGAVAHRTKTDAMVVDSMVLRRRD